MHAIHCALALAAVGLPLAAQTAAPSSNTPGTTPAKTPGTTPERTGHQATSTAAEVATFLADCRTLIAGDRLTVQVAGKSHAGRDLTVVRIALPGVQPPPLRALVIGSIHAGECEGKEALQVLLREFASGQHAALLAQVELWFLPIYNVDGNEQVGTKNRAGQNGPDHAGQRENAQGLDLNRDFVKAEAPETQTLLRLFQTVDPHLFVDLHTTNGSYHGYHLTYAPSLSPNVDPELAALHRTVLDGAASAMQNQGFHTFDYGNFETRDLGRPGMPMAKDGTRGWFTYDHRARYGVNCFGLRNRLAILSEAYSYADFATRIAATRAFVLALLEQLTQRSEAVRATAAAADRRLLQPSQPVWFGFDTAFAPSERTDVLVSEVDRIDAEGERPLRFLRKGDGTPTPMPVCRAFRARQQRALPVAWVIPAPTAEVRQRLAWHGIECEPMTAKRTATAQRFAIASQRKPKRPYQGHQELVLVGQWEAAATIELPVDALWIPANQRLGRLAATLLEPESEDSLSTWNFFEAPAASHYAVLRICTP